VTLSEKAKAKVADKARGVKENVQSIAKSVSSAVKEEAERLQELKARLAALESSEESEEEAETGALQDVMDHLTSLHAKIEQATSPTTSPRSPVAERTGESAAELLYSLGDSESGGALTTVRARMVNEKRKSWHSRQLEMRSIDAFLKQSKRDKDEDARLRRQNASSNRRESDKRERKASKRDSKRRKKQMRKLGECVRECYSGLVKQISEREDTMVTHDRWSFDLPWFLFVTRALLTSGKQLIFLSEDRQGGDVVIARARTLKASLLKLDDLLKQPPAAASSSEDSLSLKNFGLFRTNILDDLLALVAALKVLWKRPTSRTLFLSSASYPLP
jgi:hypothetical protein